MRFLGVDLAWKDGNPSGVALLDGQGFPLHLREIPLTLSRHAEVLGWIAKHVAHPNALQVLLFALDGKPGLTIMKYKQRHFGPRRRWVEDGLRPFIERCRTTLGGRYVVAGDSAWRALVDLRPRASMSSAELKSIEDRWDAILCAVGAALEVFQKSSMRFYPDGADTWRSGYILAPALPGAR